MANFTGTLSANLIYTSIFNMIISQEVFADNIFDTKSSLVDMSRTDGGLYGDKKLFYSTDVIASHAWGNDAEAANLLKLHRAKSPECQEIKIDTFRQAPITVDDYLTKQAWMDEGAFSSFNSILLAKLRECKRIYDSTTFNCYLGTAESAIGKQTQTIDLVTKANAGNDEEKQNKINSMRIAKFMSDLMVDLEDVTRDYNDYKHLRSMNSENLIAVWRSGAVNKIDKMALPVIYHKDNFIDKLGEYTLPDRYFGKINTLGGTVAQATQKIYALYEKVYTGTDGKAVDVFPGQPLPDGAKYDANETYSPDETILFKIIDKRSIPFMSAFEAGTSFFNPASLTQNEYLTWGHNHLEYLKHYPMITIRGVEK